MRSRIAPAGARIPIALALAIILTMVGCAAPKQHLGPRIPDRHSLSPESNSPVVLVFFVDGIDADVLDQMTRANELPNIANHFIRGGVTVEHAVTSMPSITYPNAVSLITGRFPGHHGVLGNQWFDRDQRLIRDYGSASTYQWVNDDFDCPTVFELLGDRFTVSVQAHTRRGVSLAMDNQIETAVEWMLGDYSDVDELVGECANRVIAACRSRGARPAVYLSYFPGVDEVGHQFGPDSNRYAEALRVADHAVGQIITTARRSWGEPVYCVLISDHGHISIDPDRRVDLASALSRLGLAVHQGPAQSPLRSIRSLALDNVDTVLVVGAYRRAAIHVRGASSWDEPADPTRVAEIANTIASSWMDNQPSVWSAVELMCLRAGDDAVVIRSRRGTTRVERRHVNDRAEYRLVAGAGESDVSPEKTGAAASIVLGYDANATVDAFVLSGWRDGDEWLSATANAPHPDFVVQVIEMFDSPRTGDLVLFAAEDWSFDDESAGGHGSSLRTDMHIPMFWSGPDLPRGASVDAARLVDVTPTILDLFGLDDAAMGAMDGESLLPRLRGATVR